MRNWKRMVNGGSERRPRRELRLPAGDSPRLGLVFFGLCALVALVPIPLGSARPLAWDMAALATGILLVASVVSSDPAFSTLPRDVVGPLLLFLAVACVVVLQLLPETPVAWHNEIWELAAETLGHPVRGTVAADPHTARVYLLRLLSYAGVFYLTVSLCRDRLRAHAALKFAAIMGTSYAVYSVAVYWSGNKTILWMPKWAYNLDLTGTFVNRNHFATFLGLCILATLAHFVIDLRRLNPIGYWRTQLSATVEFMSGRVWLFVAWLLLATALLLTHSRGGLIATFFGVLVFVLATALAPSVKRRARVALIAVPLALGIFGFVVNGKITLERMSELMPASQSADAKAADRTVEDSGRLGVDEITLRAVADHPLLGTGLGSFASVFPLYRTREIADYYDKAHDDYVQNLLELGIPAASCLFLALAWLTALCVRGAWTRQRDAALPCLGIAATALVGLHATVDFSLQIPAVTMLYMFLLGIAVAQSRSSRADPVTQPLRP